MTDYPTIRIKCGDASMILAGRDVSTNAGQRGGPYLAAETDQTGPKWRFKRTKTGVTVRQIEGRAG